MVPTTPPSRSSPPNSVGLLIDRLVRPCSLDNGPRSASPHALEGSATLVWRALAEGAAPAERIAERAAAVAGADPQEIADDVVGFLAELESAALIERR